MSENTGFKDNIQLHKSSLVHTESQEERKERKKKKEWYRPWIDHATGTYTSCYIPHTD